MSERVLPGVKGTMLDKNKQKQLERLERIRAVDGNVQYVSDEGAISIDDDEMKDSTCVMTPRYYSEERHS